MLIVKRENKILQHLLAISMFLAIFMNNQCRIFRTDYQKYKKYA
jgi:hypothetical protein